MSKYIISAILAFSSFFFISCSSSSSEDVKVKTKCGIISKINPFKKCEDE